MRCQLLRIGRIFHAKQSALYVNAGARDARCRGDTKGKTRLRSPWASGALRGDARRACGSGAAILQRLDALLLDALLLDALLLDALLLATDAAVPGVCGSGAPMGGVAGRSGLWHQVTGVPVAAVRSA